MQESREAQMNSENPRFATNLKNALKTKYNKFVVSNKIKVQNTTTGGHFFMKSSELPIVPKFSLNSDLNVWRIRNREATSKTYKIRNNQLDIYAAISTSLSPFAIVCKTQRYRPLRLNLLHLGTLNTQSHQNQFST